MKQEHPDANAPTMLPKPQAEFVAPVADVPSSSTVSEKELSQIVEKIHTKGQATSTTPQQSAVQADLTGKQTSTSGADVSSKSVAGTSSLIADDIDLIEKEWVEKAKFIINSTKNDPYAQNKKLHQIKAEYLKARFNKEVKLSQN